MYASIDEFQAQVIAADMLYGFGVIIIDRIFSNGGATGCDITQHLRSVCSYTSVIIGSSGAALFRPKPPPSTERVCKSYWIYWTSDWSWEVFDFERSLDLPFI
jgi:hypothetical protein